MQVLAELTPLDPVTGTRPVLRVCSEQDRAITALNGVKWWPAMVETPVLTARLFDGDFSSDVDVGGASMAVLTDKLLKLDPNAGRFRWAGAGVKIYAGNSGDAWPWTQWFEGVVTSFEARALRLKLQAKVNTEPFEKDALTATYAGTGGIEGDANLKNKVKPWVFGRALNVEPVLVNAVDNVYQFSGYGPIQAVNALYERASDFGASVGDFASYAALVAATVPAGRWATCLALGLIRLGAPAYGVITGDVDGDKPGGVWIRKTGEIITRITANAGISSSLLDTASLAALDVAVPYNINLVLDQQTTVLDLARRLARPCNAQAGISWLGKLFTTRIGIGTPAITLDAQGRRLPGVLRSVESDVSPPYWRIEMGAQRAWRVHSFDEISTYDPLVDRGDYSATAWYRAGNIAKSQDMRWRYIGAAPGSGNAPPTLPTTINAWWEALDPRLGGVEAGATRNAVTYSATPPASPVDKDLWVDTSGTYAVFKLRVGGVWVTGANALSAYNSLTSKPIALADINTTESAKLTGIADGATVGRNRILNAGAETGAVAPWVTDEIFGTGTLTADAASAPSGKYRFIITKGATGQGTDVIHPAIAVTPGKSYILRINLSGNGSSSASGLYLRMNERTSAPTGGYVTGALRTSIGEVVANGPVPAAATVSTYTYTVPAGVYFVSPAIYNWVGAPVVLAFDDVEFYELTDYELGADVTANNQHVMEVATDQTVHYNSTGTTASAGQLPRTLFNVRKKGNTVVTTDAGTSWSISVSNCTATINNTTGSSSKGQISLTAVAADGYIDVTSTNGGVSLTKRILVYKVLAEPAAGGGTGATSFSAAVDLAVTDSSFDASPQVLATGTMRTNASGAITTYINLLYNLQELSVSATLSVKMQRSAVGAGVWTDWATGTLTGSAASAGGVGDEYVLGWLTHSGTFPGGTASTDYDFRLIAFKSGSAVTVYTGGEVNGGQ